MTHTPGPWNWKTVRDVNGGIEIQTADGGNVASVGEKLRSQGAADFANAKLIAAAPELLAACKACGTWLIANVPEGRLPEALKKMVIDAIKAAEENQP